MPDPQNKHSYKAQRYRPVEVLMRNREDGCIELRSRIELDGQTRYAPRLLKHQARRFPVRTWLAERNENGAWQSISYAEADLKTDAIAQWLIDQGLNQERPIVVLSPNSVTHGLLILAAMKAQVPICSVSPPYSLLDKSYGKLKHVFATVQPKLVFVEQEAPFIEALSACTSSQFQLLSRTPSKTAIDINEVFNTMVSADVADSIEGINDETVARYFFTSGSTGFPKAVVHTQGMQSAYLGGIHALYQPDRYFDADDFPVYLGWMPWSHISAGTMTFNDTIMHGGSLYLDAGKPVPGLFDQTIDNIKSVSPTVFGSAPIGFAYLADAMDQDAELKSAFFKRLETMVYGGAAMPADLVHRLLQHSIDELGTCVPITSGYGATETHGISLQTWPSVQAGLIGAPLPGVKIKLTPIGDKTEVRVHGDAVFREYLRQTDKTAAEFDDEGYFCVRDAAKFVQPGDPNQGLLFDGRVSEDFKLVSGTWVSAGNLRTNLLANCNNLLRDAVICGENRDYVAVMAWLNEPACTELIGEQNKPEPASSKELRAHPKVQSALLEAIEKHNDNFPASSTRVRHLYLLSEPPSLADSEITDKGYINANAVKSRRKAQHDALFDQPEHTLLPLNQ